MTSTIKVDNIQKTSDGSNIIKKCGSTTTVGSGSGQTIVVDGATITLGRCGGAVNIAPGATTSGMGRSGTVDWCTTAKTSPLTAVSGKGYFINTTGGAVTVTLPSSPTAGDIVSLKDYANTWDTNNVTLGRGGSKINGVCADGNLSTESQSITLVYVDGTKGWQDIQDSTSNVTGNAFITATGGTITTSGNDKIHTFTGSGTFTVSATAQCAANNAVSYMVVAGGGYGGTYQSGSSGGAGAGGFREGKTNAITPYTASPLVAPAGITVSAQGYPITVGAGGTDSPSQQGSPSIFDSITSAGGGRGGSEAHTTGAPYAGGPGGSGGGGNGEGGPAGGNGNTPPVSPSQGNNGGTGRSNSGDRGGAGGGGAGAVGGNGSSPQRGGNGGAGVSTQITGSAVTRAGGGGGQGQGTYAGDGGSGGGGGAGGGTGVAGFPGTVNTGGGGGAGNSNTGTDGGQGGSGIVVIRYKFQ